MFSLEQDGVEVEVITLAAPPEVSAIPPDVKVEAKRTVETGEKAKEEVERRVSAIDRVIQVLAERPEYLEAPLPPSQSEIENGESYAVVIDEILEIVRRYRDDEIDPTLINQDLLGIQARLVFLSSQLSFFQSQHSQSTVRLELVRAKLYLGAKKSSQTEGIKLSDTDAKEMAKVESEPLVAEVMNLEMVAKYLAGVYYSVKHFSEILDSAANREVRINMSRNQS